MKSIRFLRLNYFIWVAIPLVFWLIIITYGLPHVRWSYDWRDDGYGYDPHAARYYTRCTYVGFYGEFTILPMNGHCSFLRLQKKVGAQP